MRQRARRTGRGLTLVELIVGMGIISILFVALGYIFQQAVACHNIATGTAEIHQEARAVFDYLRRELDGVPRDGRLVVASPGGAAAQWGVTVHGDVLTFTTATPLPVRKSDQSADDLLYNNLAAVCYYRWLPADDAAPAQQVLYRLMDRMDTGEGLVDLGVCRIVLPRTNPDTQDQLALRVVTPTGGTATHGAFEVEVYDRAARAFLPVDGTDSFDSASQGLPRALRVRLRFWDRGQHVVDERSGERGIEFQETFRIPAGE